MPGRLDLHPSLPESSSSESTEFTEYTTEQSMASEVSKPMVKATASARNYGARRQDNRPGKIGLKLHPKTRAMSDYSSSSNDSETLSTIDSTYYTESTYGSTVFSEETSVNSYAMGKSAGTHDTKSSTTSSILGDLTAAFAYLVGGTVPPKPETRDSLDSFLTSRNQSLRDDADNTAENNLGQRQSGHRLFHIWSTPLCSRRNARDDASWYDLQSIVSGGTRDDDTTIHIPKRRPGQPSFLNNTPGALRDFLEHSVPVNEKQLMSGEIKGLLASKEAEAKLQRLRSLERAATMKQVEAGLHDNSKNSEIKTASSNSASSGERVASKPRKHRGETGGKD